MAIPIVIIGATVIAPLVLGGPDLMRSPIPRPAADLVIAADVDGDGVPRAPADLHADGLIDATDGHRLFDAWGPAAPDERADLDGSGVVDADDLAIFLEAIRLPLS